MQIFSEVFFFFFLEGWGLCNLNTDPAWQRIVRTLTHWFPRCFQRIFPAQPNLEVGQNYLQLPCAHWRINMEREEQWDWKTLTLSCSDCSTLRTWCDWVLIGYSRYPVVAVPRWGHQGTCCDWVLIGYSRCPVVTAPHWGHQGTCCDWVLIGYSRYPAVTVPRWGHQETCCDWVLIGYSRYPVVTVPRWGTCCVNGYSLGTHWVLTLSCSDCSTLGTSGNMPWLGTHWVLTLSCSDCSTLGTSGNMLCDWVLIGYSHYPVVTAPHWGHQGTRRTATRRTLSAISRQALQRLRLQNTIRSKMKIDLGKTRFSRHSTNKALSHHVHSTALMPTRKVPWVGRWGLQP